MVGREINQLFPKEVVPIGEKVLEVKNLSRVGYFKDINFHVKKGEVVALTGLVGAGRTEICEAIYGMTLPDSGEIFLDGKKFIPKSPTDSLEAGIGLLPEDRQNGGLILEFEIYKNVTLSNLRKITNPLWITPKHEYEVSQTFSNRLGVKANSIFTKVSTLSGGNQQKVVFAKILTSHLKVVILDEPTKGVDVGAKAAIYELINEMAGRGYGVILISSEMPEVLGVSDRIVVIKEGKVTADLITKETRQEQILEYSMMVE